MPAAIPLIAGAFVAAGSVATAVGLGTAFIIAGTAITWTAVLTVTGVALMAISALARRVPKPDSGTQLQQKLDPQAPLPIVYGRTATGGYIVNRLTHGAKNAFYTIVTALSVGGPIAGIESYRAGDLPIGWSGDPATQLAYAATAGGYAPKSKLYKGKLRQRWQNGQAPASTTPAGATGLPIPGGALSGVAHAITSFEYNTDAFPQGLPSSLWVLRGVKLYDPRLDSTYPGGSGPQRVDQPSTWGFSENPYLAALNWTLGRWENGRRVYGIGARWSEVDVASFVAGANVADANGWKIGGQVTTSDDKFAVLASLLASGGGTAIARGAQIACSVNAPKTSILTITSDDIIGDVEIASSTSWRDRQNTIIPRYREESQNWEIISGERVSATLYVDEDGGETKTVEIEFPLVQQAAQAHQLAAYELVNSREFLTFTVRCKMRLLAARVGDAVVIDEKMIAATNRKCVVIGREFNPADQSVTLTLKSETDAKHAFALGQSQVAPPSSKLDGYDPSNPDAPAANAWAITATEISNGTTTIPTLVINGASDDPNTKDVIVEYRPAGSSVWLSAGEYPAATTRMEISSVTDGTAYEVAISYRTVRLVVGERLILTATAGKLALDWQTNITGPNRPADNATVGAPGDSPVGDLPASTVTDAIKDGAGNVIKLRDAVPIINAAISAANDRIDDATDAANGRIDEANGRITTAQGIATKAADDLAHEIQRATGAEGTLNSRIDSIVAEGGYDDTALRTLINDTRTAYADADRALGERITGVQSSFVKGGGNFLSNSDFVTLEGWHIGLNDIGATPLAKNNAGPDWQPAGFEDTMGTGSDDAVVDQNKFATIYSEPFAVTPGDWLQFYVMSASHRCLNWVTLFYYDALGNEIAYAGDYMSARWDNGGRNPAHWDQLGAKSVKVPANALSARMGLRKYATFPGLTTIRSSVAWWWRPYVGLAREGQTEWNPYVPGNTKQLQARSNAAIDTAQRTGANASQAVADLTTSVNTRFDGVNGTTASLNDRLTTVTNSTSAIGTRTTNLEVTASAASGTLNPNPDFASWSNPAAAPDLWAPWGNVPAGSWARFANPLAKGGYALDHTPGGQDSGFVRSDLFCGNGWYVMEAAVWKMSGSWNGAGVTLSGQVHIDFMATPDSYDRVGDVIGDGGVRSWSVLFQIRDDYIGAGYKNFHLMTNWGGLERGFTEKTLRWLRCAIRPATDAEVKAMKADATLNAPGGAMARLGGVETAVTDGRFATAQRANDIEVSLNNARSRLTGVENATTDGRFASAQRATDIETSLNDARGRLSTVEGATTDGRFASAQRAANLEAQMNATSESNLLARLRGTEAAVTDGRFATAQRANDIEASVNGVSGRVDQLVTVTTNGTFAAASTVNQLRSEYNNTAATVSTQAGTIAGLQGRTSAYIETTVVAANNRAQLAIRADANGGAGVDIIGDVAITGQSGGNRTIITGSGIQVYDANNVLRVRIGFW